MGSSLVRSIGFLVLFVVAVWTLGLIFGFEISLAGTLIASVVLTVVLNLVLAGVGRLRA